MEWPKLMAMNWGTIPWLRTDEDVSAAAGEMRMTLERNPPTNDELCCVIRWMAGDDFDQCRPPTLRELVRAVCAKRRKIEAERLGYRDKEDSTTEEEWHDRICAAETPAERWDVICSADIETIPRLMDWAVKKGMSVSRPVKMKNNLWCRCSAHPITEDQEEP